MKIAIVGATGLVGRTVIEILAEKKLIDNNQLFLYASEKSVGKNIEICDKIYKILSMDRIEAVDFAFFCVNSTISKAYARKFMQKGAIVIDNSSAFRRNKNVPLIVPEINFNEIDNKTKLIANPNCSTIALALPIFALNKKNKIQRIVVSTYQAVSGAGQNAILDLKNGTTKKFTHKISNNVIPQIDRFLKDGYTFEEDKLRFELNKILNSNISITATAVRIPVENCHSESVNITFAKSLSIKKLRWCLEEQTGVKIIDDKEHNLYPMPIFAQMTDDVLVGRIRKDKSCKNSFNLFLCMNNIRKGAALNAVQIMEIIIKKGIRT